MNVAESLEQGYNVNDKDLLAVFMGDDVAGKILAQFSSFESLSNASLVQLQGIEGVGKKRANQLKALVEFSRRMFRKPLQRGSAFSSSRDVFNHYGPLLRGKQQESFFAVLLDARNKVLNTVEIAKGTLQCCQVFARDVIKAALLEGALSVILVHNHPSGEVTPSQEDILLTDRLQKALELCNVKLLDHLVIGDVSYTSMADQGII